MKIKLNNIIYLIEEVEKTDDYSLMFTCDKFIIKYNSLSMKHINDIFNSLLTKGYAESDFDSYIIINK